MVREKVDYYTDCLLAINASIQPLLVILQLIVPLLGFMTEETAASFRIILTAIPAIITMPFIFVRKTRLLLLSFGIYLLLLLFYYALFPTSDTFIIGGEAFKLPFVSIITILSVYSIHDIYVFKRTLVILLRITAWFGIFFGYLFVQFSSILDKTYSMSFSYAVLLPILILFTTSKWYDLATSILCLLYVILIGARGTLFLAISFFIIYTIFFSKAKIIYSRIIIAILVFSCLRLAFPNFLSFEDSRTIKMLTSGDATNDTGRLEIYSFITEKIWERPISGWGIGADRQLLLDMGKPHSHNLILEIYVDFGIFMGSIFLLIIIWKTARKFFMLNIAKNRLFFIAIIIACVFPLMASSSFLINSNFALFVGLLISNFDEDSTYYISATEENDFPESDDS